MRYQFLVDTFETERLKTLSVWSEFQDGDLATRPGDSHGRSVHEHMVHQCVSENLWFVQILGVDVGAPPLPAQETRIEFLRRYAMDSEKAARGSANPSRRLVGGDRVFLRIAAVARVGPGTAASRTPRITAGS
jgi:hypothetical protein